MRKTAISRLVIALTATAVIVAGVTFAVAKTARPGESPWVAAWSDSFGGPAGGAVNPAYWKYDTGPGKIFGTGEVEQMTSSPANVRLDGTGGLDIIALGHGAADAPGTSWTSGRIQTRRLFTPPPGREMMITASIRQPDPVAGPAAGLGYWPAFWMLGENSASWPADGEIDILEAINGRSQHSGAVHCGNLTDRHPDGTFGPCHEPNGFGSGSRACAGCQQGFHDYSVVIDRRDEARQQIRWYFDGREFFSLGEDAVGRATWTHAFDHGFSILLDLAIGGSYPDTVCGCPTPAAGTAQGARLTVRNVGVYVSRLTQIR